MAAVKGARLGALVVSGLVAGLLVASSVAQAQRPTLAPPAGEGWPDGALELAR